MKTILLIIVALFISIDASADARIYGKLFGYDSKPMILADIIVTNVANRRDVNFYQTKPDGSFNFKLAPNGSYNIVFAGVNHQNFELSLFTFDKEENIELNIQLSPYKIDREIDELYVIGSFNAFSFDEGLIEMQKHSDGTFSAEVPNGSDTLYYQILGAITQPVLRSINGTMSDAYVYDGGGDYRSVLYISEKKVKIIFDPAKMAFPDTPPVIASPSEKFRNYLNLKSEIDSISGIFWSKALRDEFNDDNDYKNALNNIFATLENYYNEYEDSRIRVFMLDKYIAFSQIANKNIHNVNVKFITKLFNLITPQSAFWSNFPHHTLTILRYDASDNTKQYVQRIIDENPDKNAVRHIQHYLIAMDLINNYNNREKIANILKDLNEPELSIFNALYHIEHSDDTLTFRALYKYLIEKYPDTWSGQRARFQWDENRNIQVNKMVPDFKLASIDNENVIYSPTTLKGKYVLIDLWATWCGPCIGELPHLESVYNKYKVKNLEILSISFDRSPEIVKKYREGKWKMPWLHAFADGAFEGEIGKKFEVVGIPRPILIDPQGKIIAIETELRGKQLEETLKKLIK